MPRQIRAATEAPAADAAKCCRFIRIGIAAV
jgi:hypothetical protein